MLRALALIWEGEASAEPKRQRMANSDWRLVRLDFGSPELRPPKTPNEFGAHLAPSSTTD